MNSKFPASSVHHFGTQRNIWFVGWVALHPMAPLTTMCCRRLNRAEEEEPRRKLERNTTIMAATLEEKKREKERKQRKEKSVSINRLKEAHGGL